MNGDIDAAPSFTIKIAKSAKRRQLFHFAFVQRFPTDRTKTDGPFVAFGTYGELDVAAEQQVVVVIDEDLYVRRPFDNGP